MSGERLERLECLECEVVRNDALAPDVRYIVMRSRMMAEAADKGQFVQVGVAPAGDGVSYDPLLKRPISIATVDRLEGTFSLFVKGVGRGTKGLNAAKVGERLPVWGPLGNGFSWPRYLAPDSDKPLRPILVGGGVGIAPMLFLAQELAGKLKPSTNPEGSVGKGGGPVTLDPIILLGAQCSEGLFFRDEFRACGDLRLATDDGSCGTRGFVTRLLEDAVSQSLNNGELPILYTCGPRIMMKKAATLAMSNGVPCQVSMEERMACGLGACLVCVCAMKAEGYHRFKRVCADGPIFLGGEVDWDA